FSQQAAAAALLELTQCFGAAEPVLARARQALARWPRALEILAQLERVVTSPRVMRHAATVEIALDLADVRGFRYHTGLCFAVYAERHAQAVGRGGRYDGVGAVFGRARAATGFSLDLRELVELRSIAEPADGTGVIVAPWSEDEALMALVGRLRADGEVVVQLLPGQTDHGMDRQVDRMIESDNGRWQVRPIAGRDTARQGS